jgi:hypothetical protein
VKWLLAALLAAVAVGVTSAAPAADAPTAQIRANFVDGERATHYTVVVTNAPSDTPTIAWTLDLKQIDPDGEVDSTCNKTEERSDNDFIWHHGNVGDPLHDDGCHHEDQGVHGHQGQINVIVLYKTWRCEASYFGSDPDNKFPTTQDPRLCGENGEPTQPGLSPPTDPCLGLKKKYAKLRARVRELRSEVARLEKTKGEKAKLKHDLLQLELEHVVKQRDATKKELAACRKTHGG